MKKIAVLRGVPPPYDEDEEDKTAAGGNMERIEQLNRAVSGVVWGAPMIALMLAAGLFLGARCGFVQIFRLRYTLKNTLGRMFRRGGAEKGSVTPFQATATALAATVGTGNISGVAYALALGGAGALFWLWVSALIGMCTKYAEAALAVRFRERGENGDWVGGPMYYIKNGLGPRFAWLAALFCVFGALASFGIGNAVQTGNVVDAVNGALAAFRTPGSWNPARVGVVTGAAVAVAAAVTLIGGMKRIGRAAELIVPVMSVLYLAGALLVILSGADRLPAVFARVLREALTPRAAAGGAAGFSVKTALQWGLKRGIFSNEAGLGSSPIAHAGTSGTEPVAQGLYGVCEVFADTLVICTITGLSLLVSGVPLGADGGASANIAAFATVFGAKIAAVIISACTALFALATVLGWSLYGVRCAEFLFGARGARVYRAVYILVIFLGATLKLRLVWELSDTLGGLMALPNLIALLALSGVAAKLTREHFRK
ncbi:MAG: amino acid carrier protein [Oscillospiraceae bacterium]|nr:amino acid carrier protein [Oscillospiraceae bacterium]